MNKIRLKLFIIIIVIVFNFWLYWVFVAAHGLSLVAAKWGCSLVGVCGLLIEVASLIEELTF